MHASTAFLGAALRRRPACPACSAIACRQRPGAKVEAPTPVAASAAVSVAAEEEEAEE
eukprot:gene37538-28292_t